MAQKKRSPIRPPLNKPPAGARGSAQHARRAPGKKVGEQPFDAELGDGQLGDAQFGDSQLGDPDAQPALRHSRPTTAGSGDVAPRDDAEHSDKLHKVLAQAGLGSRRDMEAMITAGRVSVNGQPANIGVRVVPADRILVDGRPIRKADTDALPRILVYHKPEQEIVSRDDPQGRDSVFDKLPRVRGGKWVAVGRLDYLTSGLLIFTTSGELANRLSHPRFEVEREYAVRVMGELSSEQCAELCKGIALEDGAAKFEWLRDEGGEGANHWYRVMLREGRNREVRRMFETMGVMVSRLMRVRYGIINLPPRIKRGEVLELDAKQVKQVLEWAGMAMAVHAAPSKAGPAPKTRRETGKPARDYARQPARRRTRG